LDYCAFASVWAIWTVDAGLSMGLVDSSFGALSEEIKFDLFYLGKLWREFSFSPLRRNLAVHDDQPV
jgi:hypothetical protein